MVDIKTMKNSTNYNIENYSYATALKAVLDVRNQRQQIYADDWKLQADWELLALVKMKVARLQAFVIDKKDQNVYEGQKDTLIDGVNYLLFMLQNLEDREAGVIRRNVEFDLEFEKKMGKK